MIKLYNRGIFLVWLAQRWPFTMCMHAPRGFDNKKEFVNLCIVVEKYITEAISCGLIEIIRWAIFFLCFLACQLVTVNLIGVVH